MGTPNISSQLSLTLVIVLISFFPLNCYSEPIKGMFVFGTSHVDNGNNIFLETEGKPNYLPYGVDNPSGPTGRFGNGKTVIDAFCDHLRLPLLLPFSDPSAKGPKIASGVDFASGGSGILDQTDSHSGKVASMKTQISNFQQTTLPALEAQLGMKREQLLANYMFILESGGNDITNTYFGGPVTQTIEVFTTNLIQLYTGYVKNLYSLGARKFVIMSEYPLGCYPINRTPNECNQTLTNAATMYNAKLKTMVNDLQAQMPGSHFVYLDTYNILNGLITNPSSQGFKDAVNPCCGVWEMGTMRFSPCDKNKKVCPDRKANVFFDGVHLTEATNLVIAAKAFTSTLPTEVSPINLSQLSTI
ncbi:GDSL-like Lipase/Acylhydrolase superfamily protein [Euphorbia peplus]|nr:GDSL-like Lipase/Acylhydrolase superfamily protein [Euphorbia peplus]